DLAIESHSKACYKSRLLDFTSNKLNEILESENLDNYIIKDLKSLDLTDVLLLDWIDLSVINPQPIGCFSCYPLLNGKDNDKIFYFNTGSNFRISVFDTKLNKWEKIEQDLKVYLKRTQIPDFWIVSNEWVTDRKTGKSYTFNSISDGLSSLRNHLGKSSGLTDFAQNTVDETPGERVKYTAVLNTDGRVIVFGGVSNLLPASSQLSILDTSKTPYE
ncbi:21983_t:CDS:2, partial [Rhizophagus irregularis]